MQLLFSATTSNVYKGNALSTVLFLGTLANLQTGEELNPQDGGVAEASTSNESTECACALAFLTGFQNLRVTGGRYW